MDELFKAYGNLYTQAERKGLIASYIKALREAHGLSQKAVAEALDINVQTYAAYERGRNEAPAEILVRLSLYYDVPLDVIMQRDNMNKDAYAVQQQFAYFEKEIQGISDKLVAADPETQKKFKTYIEGLGQLTDMIKSLKEDNSSK